MHGANIDPQAYGIVDDDGDKAVGNVLHRQELSATKKVANWCYQNPFKMMGKCVSALFIAFFFCAILPKLLRGDGCPFKMVGPCRTSDTKR